MRPSWALHALVLGILGLSCVGARWDYTADDTLAALDSASARTRCVIGYETGWSFDPNVVGQAGELGAAQLLPEYGLLPEFYAHGYSDPFDPYQAVEYADGMISSGQGRNWTPILWGLC